MSKEKDASTFSIKRGETPAVVKFVNKVQRRKREVT